MANSVYKVFKTKYDGFIITLNKTGTVHGYEGKALCPKYLQKWLEKNNPIELDAFYMDAVNYGLIS